MTVDFEPRTYWEANGQYIAGPGSATPDHALQEERLIAFLRGLTFRSILDVGCGRGRLTSALYAAYPLAKYTGLDLGSAQVEATAKVWPGCEVIQSTIQDFDSNRKWDLVLTSEVLMHVPPDEIGDTIAKLQRLARKWLVIVEWVPLQWEWSEPISEVNWPHDYLTLLAPHVDYAERIARQVLFAVKMS